MCSIFNQTSIQRENQHHSIQQKSQSKFFKINRCPHTGADPSFYNVFNPHFWIGDPPSKLTTNAKNGKAMQSINYIINLNGRSHDTKCHEIRL
jgi:hypothetical protein